MTFLNLLNLEVLFQSCRQYQHCICLKIKLFISFLNFLIRIWISQFKINFLGPWHQHGFSLFYVKVVKIRLKVSFDWLWGKSWNFRAWNGISICVHWNLIRFCFTYLMRVISVRGSWLVNKENNYTHIGLEKSPQLNLKYIVFVEFCLFTRFLNYIKFKSISPENLPMLLAKACTKPLELYILTDSVIYSLWKYPYWCHNYVYLLIIKHSVIILCFIL